MTRRVLITGGAGQLAQAVASLPRQAAALGFQIRLADKAALDITQEKQLAHYLDCYKPNAVINAAAYTQVDRAETDPELAIEVNQVGPALLARACRKRSITLLHVSTDYVFDGSKATPWTESDSASPLNMYGKTKLVGEQAAREEHPDTIIVRTSWLFSEFGHNFMKTILQLANSRTVLQVVSDQYGTPTYAPQLALAILKILQQHFDGPGAGGKTFHFAGSPAVSWHGFAQEIVSLAYEQGRLSQLPRVDPVTAASYGRPAPRPANSSLSSVSLHEAVGELQNDWREGIRQALPRCQKLGSFWHFGA